MEDDTKFIVALILIGVTFIAMIVGIPLWIELHSYRPDYRVEVRSKDGPATVYISEGQVKFSHGLCQFTEKGTGRDISTPGTVTVEEIKPASP